MPTRIAHLAQAQASPWTPTIKAEWFAGRREARPQAAFFTTA